jgi:hypothetical protein
MIVIQETSCAQGHSVIKSAVVKGTQCVENQDKEAFISFTLFLLS